jgi:P-type Cu+ transporter
MAKDPVCGMEVREAGAEFQSAVGENKYDFCSGECKTEFEAEPQAYVGTEAA